MNKEDFVKMNGVFAMEHGLTEGDYKKAERLIELIAANHAAVKTPQVGDLVEGAYYDGHHPYRYGIIEKVYDDGTVEVCYEPMIPFVYFNDMLELGISVSGGPFGKHLMSELELVSDEDKRTFCDWGHCGACGHGVINFKAPVRRWKIPYERQSNTYVNYWKKDFNNGSIKNRAGHCGIEQGWFYHNMFTSFEAFKKYADYLGVTYELIEQRDDYERYHLSHDFKDIYFWSLDELPEGVKPIKGRCNGSIVTCYFRTLEHDVEFYRPNTNEKAVYDAMSWEEARAFMKENGWA